MKITFEDDPLYTLIRVDGDFHYYIRHGKDEDLEVELDTRFGGIKVLASHPKGSVSVQPQKPKKVETPPPPPKPTRRRWWDGPINTDFKMPTLYPELFLGGDTL